MKVLVNGTYVGIDIHDTVTLDSVVDPRVVRLEHLVADYFDVNVSVFTNWTNDCDAKKLLCFLLHHHCHYSIGSIAKQYNIYKHYLRTCIKDEYQHCLLDKNRKAFVDGFIEKLSVNHVKAS